MKQQYFISLDREEGIVPQRVSIERENTVTWDGVVYLDFATSLIRCDRISGDDLRAAVSQALANRREFRPGRIQAQFTFGGVRFFCKDSSVLMESPIPYTNCPASAAHFIERYGEEARIEETAAGYFVAKCDDSTGLIVRNLYELGFHIEAHYPRLYVMFFPSEYEAYQNLLRERR